MELSRPPKDIVRGILPRISKKGFVRRVKSVCSNGEGLSGWLLSGGLRPGDLVRGIMPCFHYPCVCSVHSVRILSESYLPFYGIIMLCCRLIKKTFHHFHNPRTMGQTHLTLTYFKKYNRIINCMYQMHVLSIN